MKNKIKHYINEKTGKGPFFTEEGKKLPNILMITMDMVPPEFYHKRSTLSIPSQKELGKDGITFSNVFSASPLCGPSRAALLTGRYTYITGNSERSHDGHKTELRSEDIIWPEYLKAMGYHCRHVGKSHVGTEHFMRAFSENSSPWNRWSPPWFNEDRYIEFLQEKDLERFTFKKEIRGESWDGTRTGNSYGGWLADQKGKPFPEEAIYPAFLVNRTINVLKTRENDGKPFYIQLDFFGPHQPFAIPGGMEKREAEIRQTIQLPQSWLDWEATGFSEESDDPRVYDLYRKNWGMKNRVDMMDYIVANQLQYELLDKQLGQLLDYLKSHNLYNETVIMFTADHGEMNGHKGCIDKGAYLNPQVLQVPFILKPAASSNLKRGTIVNQPCSLLDLLPTICDVTGLSISERVDGFSFLRSVNGEKRSSDKPVMFDVWNHVMPNPSVGLVFSEGNKEYIYTYNCTSDRDELYSLDESGQIRNLFGTDKDLDNAARSHMLKVLSDDARWDIYNCYFKLENAAELKLEPGDSQKFEYQ